MNTHIRSTLKKTIALSIALILTLDLGGSYLVATAESKASLTTYTPQTVETTETTDSAYSWSSLTNALDITVPHGADLARFTTKNSAYLSLGTSTDTLVTEEVVEEEAQTPPTPQAGGGGGAPATTPAETLTEEDESIGESSTSTPEVLEEVVDEQATTTPPLLEEEAQTSEVATTTPEIGEEVEKEAIPTEAEEETLEEESEEGEVEEQDTEREHPTPPAPEQVADTPAADVVADTPAAPEPETVETSSLFPGLTTISLFSSLAESLKGNTVLLTATGTESGAVSLSYTNTPHLIFSHFTSKKDDLRFKDATLYLSLGGTAIPGATLSVAYSTDGKTWTTAETLSFDTGLSNKTNGDYIAVTLTDINSQDTLASLKVRLSYTLPDGATIPLNTDALLYVDGLRIETTSEGQILDPELTLFPKQQELIETRTPEEQALARLHYANRIFELLKTGDASEPFHILNQKFLEESPLELSLVGAATTSEAILTDEGEVIYKDVYPATDFIYKPTETGLKEEILLKEPIHPGAFTYLLNLDAFEYEQTALNEIVVYQKGYLGNPLKKLYTISAPYMEDALGERSENLSFQIDGNEVTLIPDATFLGTAAYPVLIDPTVDIEVLTTYQHPLTGENWVVDFATVGESDLYIKPRNQQTIDEIEFVSLVCDGEERIPDIQSGEVLYYPNWSCDGIGTVTHLINQEGGHILDFYFGGGEEEVVMDTAFNGTVTWDGGGATNNWSECANWSSNLCPTTADDVVFDGTSTKDATLDTATTVRNFNINAGYTGTVTQGDGNNLTLTGSFTQAAGTFRGGAATTTHQNSSISKTGGTYIAASTTEFTGSSFPVGGYYNITATGGITFEDVYCNRPSYGQGSGANTNITVTGDMVIGTGCQVGSNASTGGWYVRGDVTQLITGTLGTMRLYFDGSSASQTYSIPAGASGAHVVFDSSDDINDTISLGGDNVTLYGLTLQSAFADTFSFTNPSNYTIKIGSSDLNIQTGTTFQGGPYLLEFVDGEITNNGTFTAPSTTRFSGSAFQSGGHIIYSTTTPITFEDVEFTRTSTAQAFYLGTDVIATGDVTLSGAGGIAGSGVEQPTEHLYARGNITQASSFTATGQDVNIVFDNASVAQTYTINGGVGPILLLDSSDDVNDTVTINAATGFRGLRIATAYGDTFSFNNPSAYDITIYGRDLRIDTGAGFLGGTGTTTFSNADVFIGGNFTAASTTVYDVTSFQSGNYNIYASSTQIVFDKLTISGSRGVEIETASLGVVATGTMSVIGTAAVLTNGANSTWEPRGDVVISSTGSHTGRMLFTGSSTSGKATQTFNLTGATASYDGDITINKSEGEVKLLSALDMDASSQDLVITEGTLNLNGKNLNVDGTSGTFTVADGATFKLQGGETIVTNATYPSFASGSTLMFTGDGDGASDTYTMDTDWVLTNANVTVNMTDAGDTLNGDLVFSSEFTTPVLEAYWDADEASGTTLTDESGNGRNVTLSASVDVVAGQYSNARNFVGGDSGTFTAISVPTAYSLSYWTEFPVGSGNRTPFAKSGGTYHHLLYSNGVIGVYNGGYALTSYDTDALSGWHHVAVVASGSQTEFFIDGVSVGTVNSRVSQDLSIIGNYAVGGNQDAGKMDEIRIYSTALNSQQIQALYNDNNENNFPAEPGDVDVVDFTLQSGTFTAPSTTMTVAGNFTHSSGTFTPNGGTISLDGTSQTISGNTTFYNLSKTVTAADTLTYTAGTRQTVTNAWTMTGTSGNVLTLQSSSSGTQWEIDPQNLYTLEYLSVSDSNNVNATELSINESIVTNSGNNTNWGFNNLPTAGSLGPTAYTNGSWGNDNTPTLTFTTSDADVENVKYHLLIDDSSDFSSPVVNYTSALATQGAQSFTVGQAAGSGTYTTGSSGQTLSTGSYYWRASATDASGGSGATTTANSGAVAFRIDTTAPTAGTAATSSITATTTTVTISGASDADSGLSATPYNFHDQTEDNYSGAQSATSYQFTGLVPDTEYVFDVGVTDTAGNSATSSTVTDRTLALTPTSPTATANSDTAITFSWSGGTNPPTVSYYPVNITSSTTPGWISAKTYQFTGLTCETAYQFEVKARNSDNRETATTTRVSRTTSSCTPAEEGGGGSSESGGGSGGSGGSSGGSEGGSSSPTITYTQTTQTPVDTSLQTFTITSDTFASTDSTTVVSENRVLYLTFEPPAGTQYVIIANNPDFEGGEYFLYSPDFAVQWNVCKAADGTLLPDSQCARNLEYNVYIKFVNEQGLESTITTQRVFLYDPILPDEYFEFPEQNIIVNTLEQRRVVTKVEFPFDDPFTDKTGIRTRNTFGTITNNIVPGYKNIVSEIPAPFVNSAQRYKAALKASYNITFNVVGTVTKYVTRVVNNPFVYIKDNVTINTYYEGVLNGYEKTAHSFNKTTLTRFTWLFGNKINNARGTRTGEGETGGGTPTNPGEEIGGGETGGGTPSNPEGETGGGTPPGEEPTEPGTQPPSTNPIVNGGTNTNEAVREVVYGITNNLNITNKHVQDAATVAVVLAPGLLALQQTLAFALFAGSFAWADLLWLLIRWLHDLATFFHMRNKRRTWGYVYDAKTKMPLEPVLVELIDAETGRVIDRSVTDQTGQFGFIPRVGHFRIEARKANYAFPSQKITGTKDGAYDHIYHGETFTVVDTNKIVAPNIPMDVTAQDQGQLLKGLYLKLHLIEHHIGHHVATIMFWTGFLIVSANLMIALTPLNIIIFGFYIVLVAYRYIKLGTRLWGHLINIPELPHGTDLILELTHKKAPDLLLARAKAQPDGKFFLKVIEEGTYTLTVKAVHAGKESILLREEVGISKDLVLNYDVFLG